MALSKLSGDQHRSVFVQLCNVLDPCVAVALSSVSHELRTATQALLPQLRADHEAAAALCRKVGTSSGFATSCGSCKELREARKAEWYQRGLSAADLALLGTLGSVLPALQKLYLEEPAAGPHYGVPRLVAGLGAGALPAVTELGLGGVLAGDAVASALAAALGRGTLPRLKILRLNSTGIGDVGLVALAPALRRLPALEHLYLAGNPFGDEGLAALVAPPPAGAPPPTTGGLTKLKMLDLMGTEITDAGCATLAAALDRGSLPALKTLHLLHIPASVEAEDAVRAALARSGAAVPA